MERVHEKRGFERGSLSLSSGEKAKGVHGNIPRRSVSAMTFSLRKEVIQPQVLLRLPCYDFTPIMNDTLGGCPLAVGTPTSSTIHFRDVTGGVYKARERIHRSVLIRDY
jgi:hypothetical protein